MFCLSKLKTLRAVILIKIRTTSFVVSRIFFGRPLVKYKTIPLIVQKLNVFGNGAIFIGENVQIGNYPSPGFNSNESYLQARSSCASIKIADGVIINNNSCIAADKGSIEIGENTIIGPNFTCYNSNFHSLDPKKRHSGSYSSKPVVIGKNVFIGANVTILSGTQIGDNTVIGAGCVVRGKIPENMIVSCSTGVDIKPLNCC